MRDEKKKTIYLCRKMKYNEKKTERQASKKERKNKIVMLALQLS